MSAGLRPRTNRAVGLVLLGLAALVAGGFGRAPAGTRSRLVVGGGGASLPDLVLPVRGSAWVLAAACAALAAAAIVRGFGKRGPVVLGVGLGLATAALIVWAAQGASLNLLGMLRSALLRTVPITFGAMAGVLCERAGVVNIGIEGMLLVAAFFGALVGSAAHSLWAGLVLGAVSGAALASLLAVLAMRYRVDQIVAGTVVNILAVGLTGFASARVLQPFQHLNNPGRFATFEIPLLSKVPVLGPLLFAHNVFVYLMFAAVAAVHVGLFRTRWGLRVRAVGEHPRAADTVGIDVARTRFRAVLLGGLVAGIGGAYFTLGSVGRFDEGMTAGRGFIGLAAMILGRWSPVGAFAAASVFGFADALQNNLAILRAPIPSEFLLMTPYLATILVVAGVVGRARPPAADGRPYVKE